MTRNTNLINFPIKPHQSDNPPSHMINRGDGKLAKAKKQEASMIPIVKITLLNYDSSLQETYSKSFMLPLIEGVLKRTQLAEAK